MIGKRSRRNDHQHQQYGQSLVELALFLPIFLILLAGVVEISQFVINQNRITNAARASTRFAANGGENSGMINVIINSVTQTLRVEEPLWDIYALRASFNEAGTGFEDWEFEHIYGISATQRISDVNQFAIQGRVLDELEIDHVGNRIVDTDLAQELGDLRIVGTYIIYDMDSILGLEATPALGSIYSVAQLNVMRISGIQVQPTNGCSAFPIAVSRDIRSVTGEGGASPYPEPGDFDFPLNPPLYEAFTRHQVGAILDDASEGTLYRIERGDNPNNFIWLVWNSGITNDANTLLNSLTWPGNTLDYSAHAGDGGSAATGEYPHIVRGYVEPGNSTNLDLNIDDLVAPAGADAQLPAVATAVNDLIGKDIRVITWREKEGTLARVSRFAVFKIQGYGASAADNEWLLLEFIRWDDSCGQVLTTP